MGKSKRSYYTKEIFAIFKLAINQENRVKGLKNVYEKGNVYGKANISEKGIEFIEDFDKVFLSWEQVEKSIGKLIKNDRYLDENDKKIADKIVEKYRLEMEKNQLQKEEQLQQNEVEEIQKDEEQIEETRNEEPQENSTKDKEIDTLYATTLEVKEEKSENIVFVKNNEFYEVYGADAEIFKTEFDYTVVSKNAGLDVKVDMVGIPSNSLNYVLKELTSKNYNVSVADGDAKSHYLASDKVHNSLEKMIADEECIKKFFKMTNTIQNY